MTSLFSRLQKFNKEATQPEWGFDGGRMFPVVTKPKSYAPVVDGFGAEDTVCEAAVYGNHEAEALANAELIAECRNSLPAVLNLIEAAQRFCDDEEVHRLSEHWAFPLDEFKALRAAVAVFVSGQEDERRSP